MLPRGRKAPTAFRADYKKGEMMNKIISERSAGANKSNRISINYDRHLSKHGSNLQRYYQLKEELRG